MSYFTLPLLRNHPLHHDVLMTLTPSQPSEKGNGLSPISVEAVGLPVKKYRERRARGCAYLCNSTVFTEISYVSTDDCFAAFCLVNRDWLAPHRCSHCLAAARYRSADTRKYGNSIAKNRRGWRGGFQTDGFQTVFSITSRSRCACEPNQDRGGCLSPHKPLQ